MARKLRFEIKMVRCARCGGAHTEWWKSTPPPSCAERQKVQRGGTP